MCACTSDFGFNQSTFSGIEQGENYRIPIKFFSGGAQQGFFINVNLDLSGTAGKSCDNEASGRYHRQPLYSSSGRGTSMCLYVFVYYIEKQVYHIANRSLHGFVNVTKS